MAQLIKMYNYITRYESNPFHYPTQYIQLKNDNWMKLLNLWEESQKQRTESETVDEKKTNKFSFNPFAKRKDSKIEVEEINDNDIPEYTFLRTKKELTQYFLNRLFSFQLKWASSTLSQVSFTDNNIKNDESFKFLLQSFPDIYLLMYYLTFLVKNVPVESEIILISPIGIDIIVMLEETKEVTYIVNDDRTWIVEHENESSKMLSSIIQLKRTEQIVKSILNKYDITFSIQKNVISRTNRMLFHTEPYQVNLIDKNNFKNWHENKRNLSSSLKNNQLKAMESLLKHCDTMSVRRPEWEEEHEAQSNDLL